MAMGCKVICCLPSGLSLIVPLLDNILQECLEVSGLILLIHTVLVVRLPPAVLFNPASVEEHLFEVKPIQIADFRLQKLVR